MATTTPFAFREYVPDPATPTTATPETIAELIDKYESALGDEDKAGDPEGAAFYEGVESAYAHALCLLLNVPVDAWNEYAHH